MCLLKQVNRGVKPEKNSKFNLEFCAFWNILVDCGCRSIGATPLCNLQGQSPILQPYCCTVHIVSQYVQYWLTDCSIGDYPYRLQSGVAPTSRAGAAEICRNTANFGHISTTLKKCHQVQYTVGPKFSHWFCTHPTVALEASTGGRVGFKTPSPSHMALPLATTNLLLVYHPHQQVDHHKRTANKAKPDQHNGRTKHPGGATDCVYQTYKQ